MVSLFGPGGGVPLAPARQNPAAIGPVATPKRRKGSGPIVDFKPRRIPFRRRKGEGDLGVFVLPTSTGTGTHTLPPSGSGTAGAFLLPTSTGQGVVQTEFIGSQAQGSSPSVVSQGRSAQASPLGTAPTAIAQGGRPCVLTDTSSCSALTQGSSATVLAQGMVVAA